MHKLLMSPNFIYYFGADFVRNKRFLLQYVWKPIALSVVVGLLYLLFEVGFSWPTNEIMEEATSRVLSILWLFLIIFLMLYLAQFQISKYIFLNHHLDRNKFKWDTKRNALHIYVLWMYWQAEE